jgi:5-hydroxyisourate hydrolase-like protein (transthyretin family)
MAPTFTRLIAIGAVVFAFSVSAATEVANTVTPTAGVQACVWNVTIPDERRCSRLEGGLFAATIDDDALSATFIEFSAPSHFSIVLPARDVNGRDIRLDPYPRVQWNGWNREADTKVEWLSAAKGAEWRDLGAIIGGEERELPGETRAVRFSSPKASPRTFFFAGPRVSLRIPRSEPLRAGGEIALCVEKPDIALRLRNRTGKIVEGKSAAHGCVSFAGLDPDVYDVLSAADAFEPFRTRVDAGRSAWLGTMQLQAPATVRVRIDDADLSRRYSVSVVPSFVAAAQRPPLPKVIVGGDEAKWEVRAGSYEATARPEAFPGIELSSHVFIESGAESIIILRPNYVTVAGSATRRGSAAADVAMEFASDDDSTRVTARATTGSDGRYEVVLPLPGRWRVVADTPGQLLWKPYEVTHDVPLAERYQWDIALPSGELAGRVIDAASGEPIADLAVEVRWQIEKEPPGFMTTTSDADGRFRAASLPNTTVTVQASEAMTRLIGYVPTAARNVDLTKDTPEEVIALRRSRTAVRISIVDEAGRPVTTAQLFRATADPATPLLASADGNGNIDVPDDTPLPLVAYIVATAHPWQRIVVNEPSEKPLRVALSPSPAPTSIALTGAIVDLQDAAWGLIDADGLHVPLFYHLLRQGALPVLRGSVATIPAPGSGTYRLWIRRAGTVRILGTITLPSPTVVVVNAE